MSNGRRYLTKVSGIDPNLILHACAGCDTHTGACRYFHTNAEDHIRQLASGKHPHRDWRLDAVQTMVQLGHFRSRQEATRFAKRIFVQGLTEFSIPLDYCINLFAHFFLSIHTDSYKLNGTLAIQKPALEDHLSELASSLGERISMARSVTGVQPKHVNPHLTLFSRGNQLLDYLHTCIVHLFQHVKETHDIHLDHEIPEHTDAPHCSPTDIESTATDLRQLFLAVSPSLLDDNPNTTSLYTHSQRIKRVYLLTRTLFCLESGNNIVMPRVEFVFDDKNSMTIKETVSGTSITMTMNPRQLHVSHGRSLDLGTEGGMHAVLHTT